MRRAGLLLLLCSGVALAQPIPDTVLPPAEPAPEPAPPEPPPVPAPPIAVQTEPPPPPEPELTDAQRAALANYEPSSTLLDGLLQVQYAKASGANDGFRFARARLGAGAGTHAGKLDVTARIEGDLVPAFRLLDAYVNVSRTHEGSATTLALQAGQMRVPISRQQLIDERALSFLEKPRFVTMLPERDLGVTATAALGGVLRLTAGAFNGEGPNQLENRDQRYLWTGRAELAFQGRSVLGDSALLGRFFTFGVSFGRRRSYDAGVQQREKYLGLDVSGVTKDFSYTFEYLRRRDRFASSSEDVATPRAFAGSGFALQVAYLLPVKLPPYRQSRLELAGRFDETDLNDQLDTVPATRALTVAASLYVRGHALKAQLAYTHFAELEGPDLANDQVALQLTYALR